MMTRTMVYLEPEEHRKLKIEAGKRRISMAELMRRLVKQYLEQGQEKRSASRKALLNIISLGSSGHSEISEKHDRYLGEALQREHSR